MAVDGQIWQHNVIRQLCGHFVELTVISCGSRWPDPTRHIYCLQPVAHMTTVNNYFHSYIPEH